MKLWLLEAIGWVDYDSDRGFVIRAADEQKARAIAEAESEAHGSHESWRFMRSMRFAFNLPGGDSRRARGRNT